MVERENIIANKKKLIIGISGATGVLYAIRLLEILRDIESIETHLVVSSAAARTISLETNYSLQQVTSLAHVSYSFSDIGAAIASGSFKTMGMVVIPCSVKTLSGIANCFSDNLLLRAADVTLKGRRPLILSFRETPLHTGHVRLMLHASELGATLAPPMPAFYSKPNTLQDIVDHHVFKLLDMLNIEFPEHLFKRWQGAESQLKHYCHIGIMLKPVYSVNFYRVPLSVWSAPRRSAATRGIAPRVPCASQTWIGH